MFKVIIKNESLFLTNQVETFGPYKNYEDMNNELLQMEEEEGRDFDIFHEPKDLVFDIGTESEETLEFYIILGSKIQPDHDSLGSHNVEGLPFGLTSEDTECTWVVEGYTKNEIIDTMVKNGFTYDKFL